MTLFYLLTILFTVLYIGLVSYLLYQWNYISAEPSEHPEPKPLVSIVIAVRNEEENILKCVQSCLDQKYPSERYEIIIVDDQSEDSSYELIEQLKNPKIILMRLGVFRRTTIKGSKKKALAYGITHAKGEIILTTDADCLVPEHWISSMVNYFSTPEIKLVSGPIKIIETGRFINRLQALDFSGNGLINAAGLHSRLFYLCNAANLGYRKEVFLEGDAFENNYNIASGDDIYLVDKISKSYPNGITFAKSQNAIVETSAMSDWSGFITQRLRWAGKMRHITDQKLKIIPAIVWIQRLLIYALLITGISTYNSQWILISFSCIILQYLTDFILQMDANRFYKIKNWEIWFVPMAFIHSVYFLVIGVLSLLPIHTEWKGRRI